jgi:hypothetical protein
VLYLALLATANPAGTAALTVTLVAQADQLPLDGAPTAWIGGALLVAIAFWREFIVPGPVYRREVARADKAEKALEERVLPALIDATQVLAYYAPNPRSAPDPPKGADHR